MTPQNSVKKTPDRCFLTLLETTELSWQGKVHTDAGSHTTHISHNPGWLRRCLEGGTFVTTRDRD